MSVGFLESAILLSYPPKSGFRASLCLSFSQISEFYLFVVSSKLRFVWFSKTHHLIRMLCSFLKSAISIWSSQINFRPVYVCWFFESAISIRFSDNLGGGFMSSRILKFAISLVLKYHFTCYLILKSAISIQFSETLPEELHILFLKLLKQESMSLFGS